MISAYQNADPKWAKDELGFTSWFGAAWPPPRAENFVGLEAIFLIQNLPAANDG